MAGSDNATFVDEYFAVLQESPDDLQQWGVKGMKWGVRRSPKELARARGEREAPEGTKRAVQNTRTRNIKETSTDYDQKLRVSRQLNEFGPSTLTNQELQSYITRVNLEQQYSRLTAPQKSAGRKFVEDTLKDIAKSEVKGLIKGKPAPIAARLLAKKGAYKGKHRG